MPVIFISAILGYCGVIYELVFAQTLSVLFGQSVVQYSVTIGLFLLGMGAGAHYAERFREPRVALWRMQLILALVAPLLLVAVWWLAVSGYTYPARGLAYGMCLFIGTVTGGELPLLMRVMPDRATWILSSDYFGMLLACLAFPLILLPEIGVFATLILTALLNAFVMTALRFEKWAPGFALPLLLIASLYFEPGLREWLSQKF